MQNQNYSNHRRIDKLYHLYTLLLNTALFIGSIIYLIQAFKSGENVFQAILLVGIILVLLIYFLIIRTYALKAQDRAIRAEESLRHYALTGKLLDSRLTIKQIVALRFASDAEFAKLAEQAAEGNISPRNIKKQIVTWRPDTYRV